MDKFIKSDDIVLLLDNNSPDSQNLRASFQRAGYRCPAVVIEDDGFLPEDVMSAFGLFLGNFKGEKGVAGKPDYLITRFRCRITGRLAEAIRWEGFMI